VFRAGVDEVYGPLSEFAQIPPPLYEKLPASQANGNGSRDAATHEVLSAQYLYYDDRAAKQESKEP
jgi:hypothetical protein